MILKEIYRIIEDQDVKDYEFLRIKSDKFSCLGDFLTTYPDLLRQDELADPFYQLYKKYNLVDAHGYIDRSLLKKSSQIKFKKELDKISKNYHHQLENLITDDESAISDLLISASLSMETSIGGDSAQFVFVTGNGMTAEKETDEFIANTLAKLTVYTKIPETDFFALLRELIAQCPTSREGILMQIFIPKSRAHEMMYISYPFGLIASQRTLNADFYGFAETLGSDDLEKFYTYFDAIRISERFDIKSSYQPTLRTGSCIWT